MTTIAPLNVLIADDEDGVRQSLSTIIKKYNSCIDIAQDGLQASDLLKEKTYHIVFLDVNMPEITGIELIHRIRTDYPQTIIVIVTGYVHMKEILALSLGAHEYIQKPFSVHTVESVIKKYKPVQNPGNNS